MSTEVAASADSIAEVMEMAGQLGIANDKLTGFTKTMIMLGDSTNMGAGEAAETLARFANITNMSQDDFDKLGSTLVSLGNNYATTEGEIMTMALRLAGAGEQVGMSETDILGLATALSSVGIEAEMGGTALSKAMVKAENATSLSGTKLKKVLDEAGISLHDLTIMQKNSKMDFNELATSLDMTSTELGNLVNAGNDLEYFAEISGMTSEQFTKAWEEDASGALVKFIQGLGDTSNASENAITMLSEMGITEVRLRDSLVRAANASDLFNDAIKDSSTAWSENTALVTEAERRYETVESQLMMAKNEIVKVGVALYDQFRGPLVKALDSARDSIKKFGKQLQSKEMTEAIGAIAEGIGEFVEKSIELATKVIPKVLSGLAKLIKNWDKIKPLVIGAATALVTYKIANSNLITGMVKSNALNKASALLWDVLTKKTTLATAAQKLYNAAQAMTPWGALALGVGAVVAAMVLLSTSTQEAVDTDEKLTEKLKEQDKVLEDVTEQVQGQKEAYKELQKTKEKTIDEGLAEVAQVQNLRDELGQLVDANGKVKEGYETRVGYILNELNSALGTEIKMTDGVIENYKEQQKEIDNLIKKQQAYVIWEAQKPGYEEAVRNVEEYQKAWINADNAVKDFQATLKESRENVEPYNEKLEELAERMSNIFGGNISADTIKESIEIDEKGNVRQNENWSKNKLGGQRGWRIAKEELEAYGDAVGKVTQAEKDLADAEKQRDDANKNLTNSIKARTEYEVYSELVLAGKYQEAIDRYGKMVEASANDDAKQLRDKAEHYSNLQKLLEDSLNDAKKKNDEAAIKSLEAQIKANEESLQNTMNYLHEQTSTVENTSPEVIAAWKDLAQNSTTEFLTYLSTLDEKEADVIRQMVGVVDAEGENLVSSWSTLTARSLSQITGKNVEFRDAGNGLVQAIIDGKEVGKPQALNEMAQLGADLAQKVKDKKISAEEAGKQLIDGVNNGVSNEKKQQSVLGKIGSFASDIVKKLKSAWDVHSPSRVSKSVAEMFMEGISRGFDTKENPILNQIRSFGQSVTTALQGELNQKSLTDNINSVRSEMSSALQSSLGNIRANVNGTVSLGADSSSLNEIGQIKANGGKTVIINQTNNSPKSLSRLEIWRQTNNAAQLAARS